MGIINSMKKAIAGTSAWLRGKAGADIHRATAAEVFGKTLEDVTGNERRAAKALTFGLMYGTVTDATPPMPDLSRYRHVSVALCPIENPILRKLLGVGYTMGAGQTHNIGNNAMKREADRIATSLGMNNKQRCLLRTKIKRRSEELRGAAEVWS